MKQIKVSDEVHEDLTRRKDAEGHTSLDSALRGLMYEQQLNEVKRSAMFNMARDRKERGNFVSLDELPPEDV
jgi:predicted CopG family antitoxin